LNDDPTDEELKTRQGCAEVFFRGLLEAIGCWWILSCFALVLLVPFWMR
jgi:hypothetical protein